jgi:hypothetical protein
LTKTEFHSLYFVPLIAELALAIAMDGLELSRIIAAFRAWRQSLDTPFLQNNKQIIFSFFRFFNFTPEQWQPPHPGTIPI